MSETLANQLFAGSTTQPASGDTVTPPAAATTETPAADAPKSDNLLTGNNDPAEPSATENLLTGEPEGEKKEGATEEKAVVPEKYEFKAPEGVELDPESVEAFTPIAKELGLTQDQAQKLVDFHATKLQAAQAATVAKISSDWKAVQNTWKQEIRGDKEMGHLVGGKTFTENLSLARKGLDTFGTPGLRQALDDTGLSNHPEVVRYFYRVGKAVSEDGIRVGGNSGASAAPKSLAERIFPNLPAR